MTTTNIICNGSKWAGQEPDPIETLLERLATHTLDPLFEDYGSFAFNSGEGRVRFWGNFYELSAVFDIETDDSDLCARLSDAIKANQATEAYKTARRERAEQKLARQMREREAMRSSTAGTR